MGVGIGALGFWLFLATVVVAGIWYGIREREAQHETLRRMIDGGQTIDPALLNRLLPHGVGSSRRLARNLQIGGLIVLLVAPGLALLGWLANLQTGGWLLPMLGAAALTACVAMGLLVASAVVARSQHADEPPAGR